MLSTLRRLCFPASIYFVMHAVVLAVAAVNKVNKGTVFDADVVMYFAASIIALLFWVWILNLICKSGYTKMSWALVLAPFFFFFFFGRKINWTPALPLI